MVCYSTYSTRVCVCVCVSRLYRVVLPPGSHDRSGHSGQWHSSRGPDASWASGVKNAGRPDPLSRRWMERSVRSPRDEWSDLSCQRRSTERLQYPAYTCVCVCVCVCWLRRLATVHHTHTHTHTQWETKKYAHLQSHGDVSTTLAYNLMHTCIINLKLYIYFIFLILKEHFPRS